MKIKKMRSKVKQNGIKKQVKNCILSLVVVFALAFSISSALAVETSTFSVTANKDTVQRGDTVTFTVNLENNQEYAFYAVTLNYDPDKLELKSTKQITDDTSTCASDPDFNPDEASCHPADVNIEEKGTPGKIVWSIAYADSYENDDAKIATATFIVKDSASGLESVTLSNTELFNYKDNQEIALSHDTSDKSIFVEVPLDSEPTLATNSLEFDLGDTSNLTKNIVVNYSPLDTTEEKNYSFVSNNKDIVTVSNNGEVTAVGIGNTTISVSAFGRSYTVNVSVLNHISNISLDNTTIEMDLESNKNKKLNATLTPDASNTTDDPTITWDSLNNQIATVDTDGNVTAVAPGETTITATTSNGLVASCKVNVVVPVKTAVFTENSQDTISVELSRNENKQLEVTLNPTNTTDKILWESNNKEVVTVDENGQLTAVAGGETTVTGKIRDITLTANVKVIVKAESIELNKNEISNMLPGQTNNTLIAKVNPADTTNKKITWDSSQKSVATVDENGVIKAIAPGTTVITASIDGKTAECIVKVLVPINNVVVNKSEVNLVKNDSQNNTTQLSVTITPDNAEEDKNVTWSSNNETVATVDATTGKVTAVGAGDATITGKLKNGMTVTTIVHVSVMTEAMEYPSSLTIDINETKQVIAKITPSDSTENITYDSNDKQVVTVDQDGTVHAVGKGTTTITATSGKITKSCVVTVNVPVISVNINQNDIDLEKGKTIKLNPTIEPTDATIQEIKYTSSDTKVATVDQSGNVVAIAKGKATITATVGNKSDSFVVNVLVPIKTFTIDSNQENLEIIKGNSVQLKTTINPSKEETTDDTTITWKSLDEKIATVDENGVVTGIKAGTVKITGTLKNGMQVESNITVKIIPVDSISLSQKELSILKNQKQQISVNINPTNSTEVENYIWSSSDDTIATVNENGVITGIKAGTVKIKVQVVTSTKTFEEEAEVTIQEIPLESIKVVNVKDKINIGEKYKLLVKINPSNTTDEYKLTYISSDESIVKIDENGEITGIKAGKATITVKAADGIETSFDIVVDKIESPQTGVTSIVIYILAMITALGGIALIIKKKIKA